MRLVGTELAALRSPQGTVAELEDHVTRSSGQHLLVRQLGEGGRVGVGVGPQLVGELPGQPAGAGAEADVEAERGQLLQADPPADLRVVGLLEEGLQLRHRRAGRGVDEERPGQTEPGLRCPRSVGQRAQPPHGGAITDDQLGGGECFQHPPLLRLGERLFQGASQPAHRLVLPTRLGGLPGGAPQGGAGPRLADRSRGRQVMSDVEIGTALLVQQPGQAGVHLLASCAVELVAHGRRHQRSPVHGHGDAAEETGGHQLLDGWADGSSRPTGEDPQPGERRQRPRHGRRLRDVASTGRQRSQPLRGGRHDRWRWCDLEVVDRVQIGRTGPGGQCVDEGIDQERVTAGQVVAAPDHLQVVDAHVLPEHPADGDAGQWLCRRSEAVGGCGFARGHGAGAGSIGRPGPGWPGPRGA